MLKIGTMESAYCFKYGFENGIDRMRRHGYEAMDYQEFVDTDTQLFEKTSYEFETYLKFQRKVVESGGIIIHQAHGPWRWPARDATYKEREERFEKMVRSIEGTAILGCKNMVIHPILPFGGDDIRHEQESYEINIEFMERLANVGKKSGVTICFENMPMPCLSLGSVEAVLNFVKTINSEFFKVCLDTGHCTMFGISPGDAVRLVGKEYLHALHIHDNDGRNDRHWAPFDGVIDWGDFAKALAEIRYEGVISLEVKMPANLPEKLLEYEEIGLYNRAHYIASAVERV